MARVDLLVHPQEAHRIAGRGLSQDASEVAPNRWRHDLDLPPATPGPSNPSGVRGGEWDPTPQRRDPAIPLVMVGRDMPVN
jgi:hypothetical protein